MKKLSLLITLCAVSLTSMAQTRYIDDTLFAPLRSGQGLEYRIVHKGLRSGTKVEVLEQDSASGYSQIRTESGLEGWLPTRYLIDEPIARDKLNKLSAEHSSLLERFNTLKAENDQLKTLSDRLQGELQQTKGSLDSTQDELTDIRRISQNALQLDTTNRELRETNEQLKSEVDVLTSENLRLKDKNEQDTMLLSAGLVLLGVIIALVIPMFKKDRSNSW